VALTFNEGAVANFTRPDLSLSLRVVRYRLSATSCKGLNRQMPKRASRHRLGNGAHAGVLWDLHWNLAGADASIRLDSRLVLPELLRPSQLPMASLREWLRFRREVIRHERQHLGNLLNLVRGLEDLQNPRSPAERHLLKQRIAQVVLSTQKKDADLDRNTQHGRLDGAWLSPAGCRASSARH
jgi:predicted secreted Zn-dependent protease